MQMLLEITKFDNSCLCPILFMVQVLRLLNFSHGIFSPDIGTAFFSI